MNTFWNAVIIALAWMFGSFMLGLVLGFIGWFMKWLLWPFMKGFGVFL